MSAVQVTRERGAVTVRIPLHTVSEPNTRGHWALRASRAKTQRSVTTMAVRPALPAVALPCVVTIARLAPRRLDDDNLRGALKAVRDGVADALGVDDRDPRVEWRYDQRKSCGGMDVEVRVERREGVS